MTALVSFDIQGILSGCGVLVPAGIGIVAGVFAIAKLIEVIFEKFPLQAYWAIIGLILGTITAASVAVSVVTFAVGFVIAMKLGD